MQRLTIYHNPRCSKSRGAVEILKERGADFDLVEYLESPPDRAALERILDHLPDAPSALVRMDANFRELALDARDFESREAVVGLLLAHPELMQRPVAVRGRHAVIGRPPEKVLELL